MKLFPHAAGMEFLPIMKMHSAIQSTARFTCALIWTLLVTALLHQGALGQGTLEETVRAFDERVSLVMPSGQDSINLPNNALGEDPGTSPPDGFYSRGATSEQYESYYDSVTKDILNQLTRTNPHLNRLLPGPADKLGGEPSDPTQSVYPRSLREILPDVTSDDVENLSPSDRERIIRDILQGIRSALVYKALKVDTIATWGDRGEGGDIVAAYEDALNQMEFLASTGPAPRPLGWNIDRVDHQPPFRVWIYNTVLSLDSQALGVGGVPLVYLSHDSSAGGEPGELDVPDDGTLVPGHLGTYGLSEAGIEAFTEIGQQPFPAPGPGFLTGGYRYHLFFEPDFEYLPPDEDPEEPEDPCEPGDVVAGAGSIDLRVGLGSGKFGKLSGKARIKAQVPDRELFTPRALATSDSVDFKRIEDATKELRQIVTPEHLVDVEVLSAEKYAMRYYDRVLSAIPDQDGIYTPSGNSLIEVTFENPDTSGATFNQLKVTRALAGSTESWTYTFDEVAGSWSIAQSEGDRIREIIETEIPAQNQRTETRREKTQSSVLLSEVVSTYEDVPWGEVKISRVEDPSGRVRTTSWEYYDDAINDGVNYTRIKQMTTPDGDWERYEYDQFGRTIKTVSQHLGAASGAAEALSRVVEVIYPDLPNGIDYTTTISKVLGEEIGRTYETRTLEKVTTEVAGFPGAAVADPANLKTVTTFYTESAFSGRPKSVQRPDGTMTLYSYSADQVDPVTGLDVASTITTVMLEGEPNAQATDIVDGLETTTIVDRSGTEISRVVVDIDSGLKIDEALVTAQDAQGRPTSIQHLGGWTETLTYSCCGLASQTDRAGIVTTFEEEDGGETRKVTRQGITTTTKISGLEVITERTGTDDSVIEIAREERNVAGELVKVTTTGNRVTTLAYSTDGSGNKVTTITLPNGGTRIETHYPDGNLKTLRGTAVYPRDFEYGVEDSGAGQQFYVKEIAVDSGGTPTGEWTRIYTDSLGRNWKTVRSNGAAATTIFNSLGQYVRSTDFDGVTTLYEWDSQGRLEVVAVDMDGNSQIDYAGTDRILRTTVSVESGPGASTILQTDQEIWRTDGNATPTLLRRIQRDVKGDNVWTTEGTASNQWSVSYTGAGGWTETMERIDGTEIVSSYSNGRLGSVIEKDTGGVQMTSASYTYDAHGRLSTAADARNGTTTLTWHDTGEIASVATPAPTGGGSSLTTSYTYTSLGQQDVVTSPDSSQMDYDYHLTGDLKSVSGARTYPTDYAWTPQGRLSSLTTNPGTADAQVTSWVYNATSGYNTSKTLPDSSSTSFTHSAGGRFLTRTDGRSIVTTYGYDAGGTLTSIDYSDSTPDVSMVAARDGRIASVLRDGATTALTWNAYGQLESESVTGGLLDGFDLDPSYDTLYRRTGLSASTGVDSTTQSWAWNSTTGRLQSIGQGDRLVTYAYHANSSIPSQLQFAKGGSVRMTETRAHDFLGRMTSMGATSTGSSEALAQSYAYSYNSIGQRTKVTRGNGDYVDFGYDSDGHLTSAEHRLSGGAHVAGMQFTFNYDALGNRTSSGYGGDTSGNNLQSRTWSASSGDPNQYATVTHPGVVISRGEADSSATVEVDSASVDYRQSEWFADEATVSNNSAPVLASLSIESTLGMDTDSVTRKELVPKASAALTYDANGNLLFDGYWDHTWDGENRLLSKESRESLVPTGASILKVEYDYDYRSRRIRETLSSKVGGSWTVIRAQRYLYDGWNVIATVDDGGSFRQTYLWGLDVSGTGQGAGGVGGLLSVEHHDAAGDSWHFVTCDGNGNVTALVDASTGDVSATYEYGPFGELLRTTGDFAHLNPWRFSSKAWNEHTGDYYYGYRFYNPEAGRWLNRDPSGESGGLNLYGFLGNDGLNRVDYLGLNGVDVPQWAAEGNPFQKWLYVQQQAIIAGGGGVREGYMLIGQGWYDFLESTGTQLGTNAAFLVHNRGELVNIHRQTFNELRDLARRLADDPCFRKRAIEELGQEFVDKLTTLEGLAELSRGLSMELFMGAAGGSVAKGASGSKWLEKLRRLSEKLDNQRSGGAGYGKSGSPRLQGQPVRQRNGIEDAWRYATSRKFRNAVERLQTHRNNQVQQLKKETGFQGKVAYDTNERVSRVEGYDPSVGGWRPEHEQTITIGPHAFREPGGAKSVFMHEMAHPYLPLDAAESTVDRVAVDLAEDIFGHSNDIILPFVDQ